MTAIYNAKDNCLQEQPGTPKPRRPFAANYADQECFDLDLQHYEFAMTEYNAHIATLRTLPCDESAKGMFVDGKSYEEGKDYRVVFEGVEIIAKAGTKVRVLFKDGKPEHGMEVHKEQVMRYLNAETVYELADTDIGDWHTDFYLKEFPSVAFNSVHFVYPDPVAVPIDPPKGGDDIWEEIIQLFMDMKNEYTVEEITKQAKAKYTITKNH